MAKKGQKESPLVSVHYRVLALRGPFLFVIESADHRQNRVFLFRCERNPVIKQLLCLRRQFHHVAFGKKLGKCNPEAVAD